MTGQPTERARPQSVDRPSGYVRYREAQERERRHTAREAALWLRHVVLRFKLRWLAVEREKLPKTEREYNDPAEFFEQRRKMEGKRNG